MADPEYVARLTCIRQQREQEEAEKRQRSEENRRQNELRRAQMTPEEREADIENSKRKKAYSRRLKAIKDLDPIEMALNGDYLSPSLEAEVLGQTPFKPDQTRFLRSVKGYRGEMGDIRSFQHHVFNFRDLDLYWASAELCKFALCDWRVPRYTTDYNNAGLEEMYKKQLRHVRKNDRYEQARVLVRPNNLKAAQHWARKMLAEFEAAAAKGEQLDALQAWIGMRYRPPSWVNDIKQSKEDYGFVIYKSREVGTRPAVAEERWFQVFNCGGAPEPEEETDVLDEDSFPSYMSADEKVLGGHGLSNYMTPSWVLPCPQHGFPSEQTPSAFRE